MHQVETITLLTSHSPSCMEDWQVKTHYSFNCATGAFIGEIRELGGKIAEDSVQFVSTFKANHMRNSFKCFAVKCSGDEMGGSPTKPMKLFISWICFTFSLPFSFFFFNTVETHYYSCGLHNAPLIEKSPGRWNINVDKTNKKLPARKILFNKYLCEVLSFLEHRWCWEFLLFIIKNDEKKRYCSLNPSKPKKNLCFTEKE